MGPVRALLEKAVAYPSLVNLPAQVTMQQTQTDSYLAWKRPRLTLLACALVSACAAFDPEGVGTGGYFQFLQGTQIISEVNQSGAGFMTCSAQAYRAMQSNPSLKGKVRCAEHSAGDLLPYTFLAHSQLTPQSAEVHNTSPFLTRASTSQICQAMLKAQKGREGMVILEDRCDKPAPVRSAVVSPPVAVPKTLADTRPIALQWDGYARLISGTVTIVEGQRRGTVRATLPDGDGTCSGIFEYTSTKAGQWAVSCTNGLSATGTFEALGTGNGSTGLGTDIKGKRVEFTIGSAG